MKTPHIWNKVIPIFKSFPHVIVIDELAHPITLMYKHQISIIKEGGVVFFQLHYIIRDYDRSPGQRNTQKTTLGL